MPPPRRAVQQEPMLCFEAVRRGLKNEARAAAGEALKTREPLQVVNETLIPALDVVGDAFEKGSIVFAAAAAIRHGDPGCF